MVYDFKKHCLYRRHYRLDNRSSYSKDVWGKYNFNPFIFLKLHRGGSRLHSRLEMAELGCSVGLLKTSICKSRQ